MGRNGRQSPPRPRIELRGGAAGPEEAAAIAAAIEQFLRDTAPAAAPAPGLGAWGRTALLAGAGLGPDEAESWGDPEPWGRRS